MWTWSKLSTESDRVFGVLQDTDNFGYFLKIHVHYYDSISVVKVYNTRTFSSVEKKILKMCIDRKCSINYYLLRWSHLAHRQNKTGCPLTFWIRVLDEMWTGGRADIWPSKWVWAAVDNTPVNTGIAGLDGLPIRINYCLYLSLTSIGTYELSSSQCTAMKMFMCGR